MALSRGERTSNSQSSVFPENGNRVERCRIKERSRIERRESRRIVDEMEEKEKKERKEGGGDVIKSKWREEECNE